MDMLIFNIILYLCRYLTALFNSTCLDISRYFMSISFSIHYLSMWLLRYSAYGIQMTVSKCMPIFPCLEIGYTSGPEKEYRGNSGDVMGDITNNIQWLKMVHTMVYAGKMKGTQTMVNHQQIVIFTSCVAFKKT